ncbi:hypothetical protein L1887_39213 [Cichorium endivia]|nr:hypothetical protein L1887_39213 [Cichorium endivia]
MSPTLNEDDGSDCSGRQTEMDEDDPLAPVTDHHPADLPTVADALPTLGAAIEKAVQGCFNLKDEGTKKYSNDQGFQHVISHGTDKAVYACVLIEVPSRHVWIDNVLVCIPD